MKRVHINKITPIDASACWLNERIFSTNDVVELLSKPDQRIVCSYPADGRVTPQNRHAVVVLAMKKALGKKYVQIDNH